MRNLRAQWFRDGLSDNCMLWHAKCDALLEHYRIYGTCNVPRKRNCKFPDGVIVPLGLWLANQRKRRDLLTKDREQRLLQLVEEKKLDLFIDIMASNKVAKRNDKQWQEYYQLLLQYGDQHNGNCNVPTRYDMIIENNKVIHLGFWVAQQRSLYRQKLLYPERVALLEKLVMDGKFSWIGSYKRFKDDQWQNYYNEFLQYGKENQNNYNIPRTYQCTSSSTQETLALGQWLYNQKYKYIRNKMVDNRKKLFQPFIDDGQLNWK